MALGRRVLRQHRPALAAGIDGPAAPLPGPYRLRRGPLEAKARLRHAGARAVPARGKSRRPALRRNHHQPRQPGVAAGDCSERRNAGRAVHQTRAVRQQAGLALPNRPLTPMESMTPQHEHVEAALRESEARYGLALTAGRMGSWETDLVARTRSWSKEGMALFGLDLVSGVGQVGGDADEYEAALHPEDRHLVQRYHDLADKRDSFLAEYRIVRPGGG